MKFFLFTAVLPPLPVVPPQPMVHEKVAVMNNEVKHRSHSGSRKVDHLGSNKVPLPQPPPPPLSLALVSGMPLPSTSTSRGPKSLMSLPMPQTTNDTDDLISYSPASPITPPPAKATKKGIMDLPLPPGKWDFVF